MTTIKTDSPSAKSKHRTTQKSCWLNMLLAGVCVIGLALVIALLLYSLARTSVPPHEWLLVPLPSAIPLTVWFCYVSQQRHGTEKE